VCPPDQWGRTYVSAQVISNMADVVHQLADMSRSMRLPNFDYSSPNAYFVTVITQDRAPVFGTLDEKLNTFCREHSVAHIDLKPILPTMMRRVAKLQPPPAPRLSA